MSSRARLLLLAALSGGALLVGVELMITAVALPSILQSLADWTQLRRASWIVNAYLLAYIATMPLAGRAADRFGLPRLFMLALGVFAAGAALSGVAQSLDQLIAARVIEGIGGVMVPLDEERTVLDWMTALNIPVLLVTGTYLGSLSHTLTALAALKQRKLIVAGVVVNESPGSAVPLVDTVETLSHFAGPLVVLPRLPGDVADHPAFGKLATVI